MHSRAQWCTMLELQRPSARIARKQVISLQSPPDANCIKNSIRAAVSLAPLIRRDPVKMIPSCQTSRSTQNGSKPTTCVINSRARHQWQLINTNESDVFIVKLGCSQSILMNKSHLNNYHPFSSSFVTAYAGTLICVGSGDLVINSDLTVKNVLHCPNIAINILSPSQICDQGHTAVVNQ